jgi:hypothetical protein
VGSSPAAQERLFGVLEAIEMALIPYRPDAPILVDDAGRNKVTVAEITDDADDFGIEIVVLEAVPGPEITSREAAVPGAIGGFRDDDSRSDIDAECLDIGPDFPAMEALTVSALRSTRCSLTK